MIYNENGIIINEEYSILEYINSYSEFDIIINEGQFIDKIKQAGKEFWDKLILAAQGIWKWVREFPSLQIIKSNKEKCKKCLDEALDGSNYLLIIKNEIAPYILSKGYGHWFEKFNDTVNSISSHNLSYDEIEDKLYGGNKDEWFSTKNYKNVLSSVKIRSTDIINMALKISDYTKPLEKIYNNLKKMYKDKSYDISTSTLKIMYSYFYNAIISFRKLSSACVKVCVHAIKTGDSGFEAVDVITNRSRDKASSSAEETIKNFEEEIEKSNDEVKKSEEKLEKTKRYAMDNIKKRHDEFNDFFKDHEKRMKNYDEEFEKNQKEIDELLKDLEK